MFNFVTHLIISLYSRPAVRLDALNVQLGRTTTQPQMELSLVCLARQVSCELVANR